MKRKPKTTLMWFYERMLMKTMDRKCKQQRSFRHILSGAYYLKDGGFGVFDSHTT